MGKYPAGVLVKEALMLHLENPLARITFRSLCVEIESIKRGDRQFFNDGLILTAVDQILAMPAGLALSNFVRSSIRKNFRKAAICASKIRGMICWGVVEDWNEFASLLEEMHGCLSKLLAELDDGMENHF